MKKGVLCLILILILPAIVNAEEVLKIRFYPFGGNESVDLKRYLGESDNYFVTATETVEVYIDNETGVAHMSSKIGEWTGEELVVFSSDEIDEEAEAEEQETVFVGRPVIKEVKDDELQEIIGIFEPFFGKYEREELRNIKTMIVAKKLNVEVNDEVVLEVDFNKAKPYVQIKMALENEGVPEIIKERQYSLILIFIVAMIAGMVIYRALKRYEIETTPELILFKKGVLKKLKEMEKNIDKNTGFEIIDITKQFLSRLLKIKKKLEIEQLRKNIEKSEFPMNMIEDIDNYINDLKNVLLKGHNEQWIRKYGIKGVDKRQIKRLIKELRKIASKI